VTRVLLLLAVIGLAACTTDSVTLNTAGICPLVRMAETPVEAHGNMLFVQATINRAPVTLLIDTGAERTLLTQSAIDRLQLPRDFQHVTRTIGIGSPTVSWDAMLPGGLIIGGTHFPVDSVSVGNFSIMPVANSPADGLLGADILLAFDIDLDLPAQKMIFYRASHDCPDAAPPWTEAYIGLTGTTTRRDRLLVPFELDGVQGMGVLDTGAQISSISQTLAERMGLDEEQLETDRTVMAHGAAADQVAVRVHRFHELRVGPAVMHSPVLPVVPMSDGMGDALIGADFLRGRRIWLSFSTNRVFITPLERGPWIAATQGR